MKSVFSCLVTAALFVAGVAAQGTFMINTPNNPPQCVNVQFTWTGGVPPILPGSQPNAAALEQFSNLTGTSLTWNTNIAAGTSLGLTIVDSTGDTKQSGTFTVEPGPDSSCLTQSAVVSGGSNTATAATATTTGSTTASGTTSGTTTAPAGTSTSGSSGTSSSGSTTKASSTTSASATTTSNVAVNNLASMGAVGVRRDRTFTDILVMIQEINPRCDRLGFHSLPDSHDGLGNR
ncbi:hypothetical protein A0H81_07934 [Grifola frondosa]|uniref:Uncharacterized protein n=1 Tax=Grifola frondosa TaxID=5627 RepID=A0A1C7M6S8_GRIFR|nr:hypothetical protein A0H81_07934 [Grifola frondosa]